MAKTSIINERLDYYKNLEISQLYTDLQIPQQGLTSEMVHSMREKYGKNTIAVKKADTVLFRLRRSFINPFTLILMALCAVSVLMDFLVGDVPQTHSQATAPIIVLMILFSGGLRFIQELRSKNAADRLSKLVNCHVSVLRNGQIKEVPAEELVVGDMIRLHAGERIPADLRFLKTADLFVSQSVITGESTVVEKFANVLPDRANYAFVEYENLGFMGATIISGQGEGMILAVGKETVYGNFNLHNSKRKSEFEISATSVTLILLKFMLILVPFIFIVLGLTKGDWGKSFIFALSVAIGLTPEMLPMVITTCLAKGSLLMSKKQVIVKNINAMQIFGSMDVLCVDKTGTLTNDEVLLEYYMDVLGNENLQVLDYAYLNSFYHTGARNHIDTALLKCQSMPNHEQHFASLLSDNTKIDEIPFDYQRKCASIVVEDKNQKKLMITKGNVREVASKCQYICYHDTIERIEGNKQQNIDAVINEIVEDGIKVIAIAIKYLDSTQMSVHSQDENDLILVGYLAFFDAPKKSAKEALEKLQKLSVHTKILTGDNAEVTLSICKRLNIAANEIILGRDLLSSQAKSLNEIVETHHVFAELTPAQKVDIIVALRENGHMVGFMGDGVNDVPALSEADVGISVDNAVDAAKDIADVILLKKDLNVLENGILEGRKTFSNMSKYIHLSASSNFGNIFSIICASIFLPFLPMAAIQLVILNIFYDMICIVLPWDEVDEDMVLKPSEWSGQHLSKFMICFGLGSSIFDLLTFMLLYFVLCPALCGGLLFHEINDLTLQMRYITIFQTGWFLESMWTQVFIIYMLRTKKMPFIQSSPSIPVIFVTMLGIACFTAFSYLPISQVFGMMALPVGYLYYLIIIVLCYMLLTTLIKTIYIKKYKKLF